jgi:hypothetical protein
MKIAREQIICRLPAKPEHSTILEIFISSSKRKLNWHGVLSGGGAS